MPIDLSAALADVIPQLNAQGAGDLLFWTTDDIYRWFDEAAQRLARTGGVFVVRDTSITTAIDTPAYALPATQVSTIQVDLAGTVLRPRTIAELEALDALWPQTIGTPEAFVQDTQGLNQIALYPNPDATGAPLPLGIVMHATLPTIDSGHVTANAPICLREYFTLHAIGEARAAETKAAMPEIASWCRGLVVMFETVIEGYWGEAQ